MKFSAIFGLTLTLASAAAPALAATAGDNDGAGPQGGVPNSVQNEPVGRGLDDVGVNTGSDVTDGTATSDGTGIADGLGKLDNGPTPAIGAPGDSEVEVQER